MMTDLEPAPKELLNFVRCNCKTTFRKTCATNLRSCRKNGVAARGDYSGENCNNSSAETEDDNDDRNLFGQFENFYF